MAYAYVRVNPFPAAPSRGAQFDLSKVPCFMFLTTYRHDMLMVHPPPPTTLIFGLVEHPPPMHGLPPSMLSFSQSLGVYSPMQFLAWTMESMLKRVQTVYGLCPSSLAPRPGICSKHLNPHSHTLLNSSSRYLPGHFFARLSLGLTHSLQSSRFYAHF